MKEKFTNNLEEETIRNFRRIRRAILGNELAPG